MSVVTPASSILVTPPASTEEKLYEVVNGHYVQMPPMGAYETTLATFLCFLLEQFAHAQKLGRCAVETLFLLDAAANTRRRPDVAFVSYERWARGRAVPRQEAWEVVPNLAVEIVSPTNTSGADVLKLQDYFRAGVQRVWVIYPEVEHVYVYTSPIDVRIFPGGGTLEGDAVLPGFRLPVARLFAADADA
jgi:Uma2 family endonuclease